MQMSEVISYKEVDMHLYETMPDYLYLLSHSLTSGIWEYLQYLYDKAKPDFWK